jgi:hypothetical protein
MADATRNIPNSQAHAGPAADLLFPLVTIDGGVTLYQGVAVFRDPADSMKLKTSPSNNPMFVPYGVSSVKQVGDDALQGELTHGPHVFDNATGGDEILSTLPLGWPVYAKDNRTASLTDGGGLYPCLGWFGGMTGEGTPRPIVWVGFCPFAIREIVVSKAIGHADLDAAATTQDFTLYTLPGPVVVVGVPWVRSLTVFSGGSISACLFSFGADADVDAIGDEVDIFTGATAAPKAMTAGVNGAAGYPLAAGVVLKCRVAATGDNVVNASAGALVASYRLKPGSY